MVPLSALTRTSSIVALAAVFGAALAIPACGPDAAPPRVPVARSADSAAAASVAGTASASAASVASASSAPAVTPPAPADTTVFPPPAFAPPFERVARAGDGTWNPVRELPVDTAPPVLVQSLVHPHPIKRFTSVALAAFDLRGVDVRLVAGTAEPESAGIPAERRTGLVPSTDLGALLAVFNGGFQAKHGRYGMRVGQDVFLPPREDSCTFGLHNDGTVSVGTWTALRDREAKMLAWRQTPPCLLEGSALNPGLEGEASSRKWGISIEGNREIRRSAIGIDATGRILLFGIGEEVAPKDLAVAMKAAGAIAAAQLDINWSYTRFLVYARPDPALPPEVVFTLLPKMKHGKLEYVSRAAPRDFFYVRRK